MREGKCNERNILRANSFREPSSIPNAVRVDSHSGLAQEAKVSLRDDLKNGKITDLEKLVYDWTKECIDFSKKTNQCACCTHMLDEHEEDMSRCNIEDCHCVMGRILGVPID